MEIFFILVFIAVFFALFANGGNKNNRKNSWQKSRKTNKTGSFDFDIKPTVIKQNEFKTEPTISTESQFQRTSNSFEEFNHKDNKEPLKDNTQILDELEKLSLLKTSGVVSDEEFLLLKKRILGNIK